MSDRGIIIAPRYFRDGSRLVFPGLLGIEPEDLRFYLLYWDRIDFPDNNLISIGSSPDIDFLRNADVLHRSEIQFGGGIDDLPGAYAAAQFAVLRSWQIKEPGLWTLGQGIEDLFVPEGDGNDTGSVEVELYRALPTPTAEVSLADVLEFREKRKAERDALRIAMDDLYSEVLTSPDVARAKIVALDRVKARIADLYAAARSQWASLLLSRVKVSLSLQGLAQGAASGVLLAERLKQPLVLGASMGALATVIRLDWSPTGARTTGILKDYAYVLSAKRELV